MILNTRLGSPIEVGLQLWILKRKTQMKTRPTLLLIVVLFSNLALAQDPLGGKPKRARTEDDYKPRTLKEVTTKSPDEESLSNKEETMIVQSDFLPSRVRAAYKGSVRNLPQIKRELLRQWALRYAGSPEFYTVPYESEMLFVENGTDYWLAVKKGLIPKIQQQFNMGEKIDLFLLRMGKVKTSNEWESLLLIEKFQKPK